MLESESQALLSLQPKGLLYVVAMEKENPFRAARVAAKKRDPRLTQGFVAEKLGVTPQAISGWERGGRPDQDKLKAISRLYKVSVDSLLEKDRRADPDELSSEDVAAGLPEPPKQKTVRLVGYVGAGAKGHFYRLADEDYTEVPAPPGGTDKTVAVEIKGKSFGPLLDTWLVYYDDVRSPVEPDMFGEVCVIGLSDDRILVKKIVSNGRGGFNLLSNIPDEEPIENAEIEWAAKVIDIRPGRKG